MSDMPSLSTDRAATATQVEALRARLEAERLRAIEDAAAATGPGGTAADHVSRIAHLQMALMAVRDEIDAHLPKLGSGSEAPL